MGSIDDIFLAALRAAFKKYGTQRKLSINIGYSEQHIGKIFKGQRYGSETARRKIAAVLGYPSSKEVGINDIHNAKSAEK